MPGLDTSWLQTEVAGVRGRLESESEVEELAYELIDSEEPDLRTRPPCDPEEQVDASEGDRYMTTGL